MHAGFQFAQVGMGGRLENGNWVVQGGQQSDLESSQDSLRLNSLQPHNAKILPVPTFPRDAKELTYYLPPVGPTSLPTHMAGSDTAIVQRPLEAIKLLRNHRWH